MRSFIFLLLILRASLSAFAQSGANQPAGAPVIYQATSDWQRVTLRRPDAAPNAGRPAVGSPGGSGERGPAPTSGVLFRPAFRADFTTNRNGWKAGPQGDYVYQVGLGDYRIRKRRADTKQAAFSYVALPPNVNLNRADTFTIKVDMLADSGRIPAGGLLFGVRDSLNYSVFAVNARGQVSVRRVANGESFAQYMPGDYFAPGVRADPNRNRLTIRRQNNKLHFYLNEREIRSSPYEFRTLAGNGIGVTTASDWIWFQKLSATLGP